MDLTRVVVASGNKNKIKEIKAILPKTEVIPMSAFDCEPAEENGATFEENAVIKAKAVYEAAHCPVLSDDSGLCVEALDGAPGIISARFAGEPANDAANNEKLLRLLSDKSNRRAKFVSVVVLYYGDGRYVSAYGETEGEILRESRGTNGFGYDSLFYSYALKKSFGEASDVEKNSVSHRAAALAALAAKLKEF